MRDPGRGIAPEHHERIFEVFQSFGRRSDERRGTGIGLAIVKKIAQTHGGRAWVESRPGHGSTFHVTLPRALADERVARLARAPARRSRFASPRSTRLLRRSTL